MLLYLQKQLGTNRSQLIQLRCSLSEHAAQAHVYLAALPLLLGGLATVVFLLVVSPWTQLSYSPVPLPHRPQLVDLLPALAILLAFGLFQVAKAYFVARGILRELHLLILSQEEAIAFAAQVLHDDDSSDARPQTERAIQP